MNQGNPERFGNPVPRDTTSAERTTCERCGKQVIPLIPHPCVGPVSPVRPHEQPLLTDEGFEAGHAGKIPVRDPAPPDHKALSPEHRAQNEESFKQSGLDWCAHQMAYNWPRNRFGSLLTEGEYEVLVRGVRDPSPPEPEVGAGPRAPWRICRNCGEPFDSGRVEHYCEACIKRGADALSVVTKSAGLGRDQLSLAVLLELSTVAGVRGAGVVPQEPVSDALALIHRALALRNYGDKPVLWEQVWKDVEDAAHRLGEALAVGSERGVVPSAPSSDLARTLLGPVGELALLQAAAEDGIRTVREVIWPQGVESAVRQLEAIAWTCRTLRKRFESGGVDSGGVAPAGPWVVERFYTQDKWFVRRGIEIPGEMSQFALHWFRSEAEAEAVCDVLNRVAAIRPASSGNAVGEALPKP